MVTIYSLDYSLPNLEPVSCSMSSSNSCFLTCIQISQEAGQMIWYSHLLKNFPEFVVVQTVKGFGIVNKAEVDVFLELFCFFDDPVVVGNLISGSWAFSKSSLNIWKFTVHELLKPGLKNFEHYFASVWKWKLYRSVMSDSLRPCGLSPTRLLRPWDSPGKNTGVGCHFLLQGIFLTQGSNPGLLHCRQMLWDECNCAVVWAFFGIAFLRDWNENWTFPVLWPLLSFPNLLAYWVQHFHSIIF